MHSLFIISTVFTAFVTSAEAVNGLFCITPTGAGGTCQPIDDCKYLADLNKLQSKTSEEERYLGKHKCDFPGNVSMVCCSNDVPSTVCYDPNGNEGKCVDISRCAHLAELLKSPASAENVEYLKNSKCRGITQSSVCCGPTSAKVSEKQRPQTCKTSVTAYPPDRSSKCCGVDDSFGNRIYGGNATAVDQYPWLALIDYYKDGVAKQLCGGALISGRYVLTAAHCVVGDILKSGTPRIVRLSEYDKRKDGPDCILVGNGMDCTDDVLKIPIEKTIPHPQYNTRTRYHDIALIKLANLAPYNAFIRPICLPSADITLSPPENFSTFAAGWGKIAPEVYSDIKLYVELPFVNLQQCQNAYTNSKVKATLWEKQICAGGQEGADSCRGDSGGPLMYENDQIFEVIGVISYGIEPCGTAGTPGVYTKVFEYKEWILSNMKS